MTTTTDVIHQYLQRAATDDLDAYLALFAADAVVEDEAHEYRGADQIRAWRSDVPPVRYDLHDTTATAAGATARVAISGDFPGSPVTLIFAFVSDDAGLIKNLTIRPEVAS